MEATAGNVKQIERERTVLLKKEAGERATADAQADQMRSLVLNFERKSGEQGALYGSVTSMDIAEALKDKGYEIDRHRIQLREPLKRTGDFVVPVRLHREVTVELAGESPAGRRGNRGSHDSGTGSGTKQEDRGS